MAAEYTSEIEHPHGHLGTHYIAEDSSGRKHGED
jgi:hypothetical protein